MFNDDYRDNVNNGEDPILEELGSQDDKDDDSDYKQSEQQGIQEIEEDKSEVPQNFESNLDGEYWSTKDYSLSVVQPY